MGGSLKDALFLNLSYGKSGLLAPKKNPEGTRKKPGNTSKKALR